MKPLTRYALANLVFLCLTGFGLMSNGIQAASPLYLVILFALCAVPLLKMSSFNDRYCLLAIFCVVYFLFFGALDSGELVRGNSTSGGFSFKSAGPMPTATEWLILVSLIAALTGYLTACSKPKVSKQVSDWTESSLMLAGAALWILCTALSWHFRVHIISDTSMESIESGLKSTSATLLMGFMLAVMLQPLGILILAYAQTVYARPYLGVVLIAVVIIQLLFGFIVDVKGDALIGAIIVILTRALVKGTVPGKWLLATAVFLALAFPVLQANRVVLRGENQSSNADVAANIFAAIGKAISAKDRVSAGHERAQTLFERMSLKGSVQMIVERTGSNVKYQEGYTLVPLVGVFIPRVIWPTKPDVQTGRLLNSEFQVTEQAATYISPSHLGEFYWNFGWLGAVLGMLMVGALLGFVGYFSDLSVSLNVTRLMVLVVTIKLLIFGFESTIAATYAVWLRSLLAIGVLHMAFARPPAPKTAPESARYNFV